MFVELQSFLKPDKYLDTPRFFTDRSVEPARDQTEQILSLCSFDALQFKKYPSISLIRLEKPQYEDWDYFTSAKLNINCFFKISKVVTHVSYLSSFSLQI